jgi:DNA-binding transcriptional ArsR family regulator
MSHNCCSLPPMPRSVEDLRKLSDVLQTLGDPQRLWLVCSLAARREPVTLTQASACCGVHLSGVSRHLSRLVDAGLVDARKDGRRVLHTLRRRALVQLLRETADWIEGGAPCCIAQPKENP